MNSSLRQDADKIITDAIAAVLPDRAVQQALEGKLFPGRVIMVAAGKAAWQMAKAAYDCLGGGIDSGVVITKYGHVKGVIGNLRCFEAGHPVPDENGVQATQEAVKLVSNLTEKDTVLFLLSGGGSALFDLPLIPLEELQQINEQLLASGADILQINTIRKRLSRVKGGRFAQLAMPAQVYTVVLSDVLGDRLDVIASGPAYPDGSTCEEALAIAQKYQLNLSERVWELLRCETPKELPNVDTVITGSVRQLCTATASACEALGYETTILRDDISCEARQAGQYLATVAAAHAGKGKKLAFVIGGETVVKVTGKGKGGRNQELALSAAAGIQGLPDIAIFSIGSDGTDGPTDAAGGYVDGQTATRLHSLDIEISQVLRDNDAYHALQAVGGLVIIGPTGTNVNDVAVALIDA